MVFNSTTVTFAEGAPKALVCWSVIAVTTASAFPAASTAGNAYTSLSPTNDVDQLKTLLHQPHKQQTPKESATRSGLKRTIIKSLKP